MNGQMGGVRLWMVERSGAGFCFCVKNLIQSSLLDCDTPLHHSFAVN